MFTCRQYISLQVKLGKLDKSHYFDKSFMQKYRLRCKQVATSEGVDITKKRHFNSLNGKSSNIYPDTILQKALDPIISEA